MREYADVYRMSDKELKTLKRNLKLKIERRRKILVSVMTLVTTVCMILIGVLSYNALKTNANSDFKYYTKVSVEVGDTLWDIADEYIDYDHYENKNSYIAEVQSINHLDASCSISAGQMLIVPYYSEEYK